MKRETPKTILMDEFVCLRSKLYSFNCGDDRKNNIRAVCKSQPKTINFGEFENCLDGKDYEKDIDISNIR